MNEIKKENSKKIFLGICIGCIIVGLIVCFGLAYNNIKTNNNAENNKTSVVESSNTNLSSSTNSNLDSSSNSSSKTISDKSVTITNGGSYDLSGSYESITINTKQDVTLNLNGAEITSSNGPGINVIEAKKVTIVVSGANKVTATTNEELDGAIYSKADLEFSGTGSLEVKSNFDGIVSKDTLVIKNGTYSIKTTATSSEDSAKALKAGNLITISGGKYNINSVDDGIHSNGNIKIENGEFTITSKDDGIHADGLIEINGGTFNINAQEGIEATYVKINDGTINIEASDDGINAGNKSSNYSVTIEINGGNITIKMGQGDTDGIDSNGDLYINGGTIDVTCNSPFDYDGKAEYNGGTLIVNGTKTDTITNQMMGGGMRGGNPMQMNQNGEMPTGFKRTR